MKDSKNLNESLLFILPDYNHTTTRSLGLFLKLGYKIDILAPYDYRIIPSYFKFLPKESFLFKVYKRKQAAKKTLLFQKKGRVRIISLSFLKFLKVFIKEFKSGKQISNIFKDILQRDLVDVPNYKHYKAIYSFDTVSFIFQDRAKKAGIKTILEIRGSHFQYSLETKQKLNQRYGTNIPDISTIHETKDSSWWFEKLISEPKRADFLIAYSKFHKNQYIKYAELRADQVYVLPLPSTISKTDINRYADQEVSFVYVGNLSYIKGIPILISAWEKLSSLVSEHLEIELNLFGACIDQEIMAMLKNATNVNYHGAVEHEVLMEKLKSNYHVFVFPSLLDTFGLALQEALQLNFPVISNLTTGAAEHFEDGIHGLKYEDSYSVDQLTNCMLKFCNDPKKVSKFSKAVAQLPNFDHAQMYSISEQNVLELSKKIGES